MSADDPTVPFRLPMFPLGLTVFPTQLVPLHVFEDRYRAMMEDVLSLDADQSFGISLIERGHEVGGGDVRTTVATRVELVQAEEFEDGRWGIVAAGVERIDVVDWLEDDPYPQAMVRRRERVDAGGDLAPAETMVFTALGLANRLTGQSVPEPSDLSDDPLTRLDQLSALAPLAMFDRQQVLEAASTTDQLATLIDALELRIMLMEAELEG